MAAEIVKLYIVYSMNITFWFFSVVCFCIKLNEPIRSQYFARDFCFFRNHPLWGALLFHESLGLSDLGFEVSFFSLKPEELEMRRGVSYGLGQAVFGSATKG